MALVQPSWLLKNRVRVYPPEEVTTASPHEVAPEEAGLTQDAVDGIWRSVTNFYRMGLQPAIALCVRRHGRVVLDRAVGHARGNVPGAPPDAPLERATPDTLFNLFSASKAITAMLVHLLNERGLLHLDDPIAEYIPEFGRYGKEHITLRHILSHRAGIPAAPGDSFDLDLLDRPEEIIRIICETRPATRAGRKLAYHAVTGGFLCAEIVRRVSGKNVRALLDEEVRQPLSFTHLSYGVRPHELDRVAVETFTGPRSRRPFSRLLQRSLGMDMPELVQVANDPRFLTGIVPSGNIIATANEAGRYFELLLRGGELDGVRVFDQRTVRRAVAEQNYGEIDDIIMLPVRYSMGFMLGGERLSFYGRGTPAAFGHLGFTNVLAWADPERDISVAFMTNGKPFVTPELVVWLNIMRVIARLVPRDG